MNSRTAIHLCRLGTAVLLAGAAGVWYLTGTTPLPAGPAFGGSPGPARGDAAGDQQDHAPNSTSQIHHVSHRLWQRPLEDPPPTATPPPPPPPPPRPPQLRIKLVGTATNPHGNAAVLRDNLGQTRYCVVGSTIDSARVIAIGDGEVVLRQGRHDITLKKEEGH